MLNKIIAIASLVIIVMSPLASAEKVFSDIAQAQADSSLQEGEIFSLQGYYQGVAARHQRIVSATEDGSSVKGANGFLNIYHDGLVQAKWFGAKGDGQTDDAEALQKAFDYESAKTVVIGQGETFCISKTLYIQPAKTYLGNDTTLQATFDKGFILEPRETDGRPAYILKGNRFVLAGRSLELAELNGLRIGSSAFSLYQGLVVTTLGGHSIVLAAKGTRDIISFTIERLETNTGKGMKFLTGTVDGVHYRNITDGSVRDSFISCVGPGAVCVDMDCQCFTVPCNTGSTTGSIFGVTFDRCAFNSCHPGGGSFVRMVSHDDKSNIYSMEFSNCEGEFRLARDVKEPPYPAIYLERVDRSHFDIKGQLGRSNGIHLVRSCENSFDFAMDQLLNPTGNGMFLVIDKECVANSFHTTSAFLETLTTDGRYRNAPHAWFVMKHFRDEGAFTTCDGLFTTSVIRHLGLQHFSELDAKGQFIHPMLANIRSMNYRAEWTAEGTLKVVLPKGDKAGFGFFLPKSIGKDEVYVVNMEYRVVGAYPDTKECPRVTAGGKNVYFVKTTEWNKQAFFTRRNGDYVYVNFPGEVPGDITLEFKALELLTGGMPYIKDVRYSEVEPQK